MAQYPIPQFIESEGKIVSFLTFRQFFILVGAGAICLVLYYAVPFYLFIFFSIFIGLLAGGIAFLKIDGIPIVTIVLNYLSYTTRSKNYVWKKKESPYPFKFKEKEAIKAGEEMSKDNTLKDTRQIVEFRKKELPPRK